MTRLRRFLAALWRPIPKAARAVDDIAVDVGTAFVDGFTGAIKMFVTGAAHSWRFVREHAKKAIPSRSVRWTVLYVPGFTLGLLFALKTFGGMDDLFAYVMEAGTRSVPVLIGIAITYGVATGLGWNLDNDLRSELQKNLAHGTMGDGIGRWPLTQCQFGAFLVLAGEMLSILALLALFIAALIVWQG